MSLFDKTFEQTLIINNIPVNVQIQIEVEPDFETPDFDYGSEQENKAEMRRFETGELLNTIIIVTASVYGVTGSDNLGQCFLRSSQFEKDAMSTIREYEMIDNALKDLKTNIETQARQLAKFAMKDVV